MLPLLLVGAALGADEARELAGFQLTVGWMQGDDRRLEASVVDFYLYLSPSAAFDIGYLREEMFITGTDNGISVSERGHVNAVRARQRVFDDATQSVRLVGNAGHADFSGHLPIGAWAFDLGVEYVPWKISTVSEVAVQLRYRYCRFSSVEVFDSGSQSSGSIEPVSNAGGFMIGISGDVHF